jgi:hypothetical protein
MTLGQEFSTYAVMLDEDRSRLAEAVELVHEINLGATAISTGLNAPAGYAESARRLGQLITRYDKPGYVFPGTAPVPSGHPAGAASSAAWATGCSVTGLCRGPGSGGGPSVPRRRRAPGYRPSP